MNWISDSLSILNRKKLTKSHIPTDKSLINLDNIPRNLHDIPTAFFSLQSCSIPGRPGGAQVVPRDGAQHRWPDELPGNLVVETQDGNEDGK